MEMCTFVRINEFIMQALIFGASGLVGRELLKLILNDPFFSSVTIVVRKKLPLSNDKLTQIISTFEELKENRHSLVGDVLFSCLGSTKRKTPNPKEYYKIDHDYPVLGSKLALENGIRFIHIVSSIGSNNSSSNSYLKMKGETEEDISKLPFQGIHIYQPSLIIGKRNESRPLEKISESVFTLINPLLIGSLKKYRSILAKDIAKAMFNQSKKQIKGIHIYPSNIIKELA